MHPASGLRTNPDSQRPALLPRDDAMLLARSGGDGGGGAVLVQPGGSLPKPRHGHDAHASASAPTCPAHTTAWVTTAAALPAPTTLVPCPVTVAWWCLEGLLRLYKDDEWATECEWFVCEREPLCLCLPTSSLLTVTRTEKGEGRAGPRLEGPSAGTPPGG